MHQLHVVNRYGMALCFYLIVLALSIILGEAGIHHILGPIDYTILGGALVFLIVKMIADKIYYSNSEASYNDAVVTAITVLVGIFSAVIFLILLDIRKYLSILDYVLLVGTLFTLLLRQFSHKLYNLAR